MHKSLLIRSLIIGLVSLVAACGLVVPLTINADAKADISQPTLVQNGHLTICTLDPNNYQVVKTISMVVTAYSSTPDQTDDTPFITASGEHVAPGIVANNMLPFGTKIRMPQLFGDTIFTVEDRMNPRMGKKHVDIWVADYNQAKDFGAKITDIEVLEN